MSCKLCYWSRTSIYILFKMCELKISEVLHFVFCCINLSSFQLKYNDSLIIKNANHTSLIYISQLTQNQVAKKQ